MINFYAFAQLTDETSVRGKLDYTAL